MLTLKNKSLSFRKSGCILWYFYGLYYICSKFVSKIGLFVSETEGKSPSLSTKVLKNILLYIGHIHCCQNATVAGSRHNVLYILPVLSIDRENVNFWRRGRLNY